MKYKRSLIEIHISVLLFGLSGLAGKFTDIESIVIVFGRTFFASISLLLFMIFLKKKIKLNSLKQLIQVSVPGIILSVHWYTFFLSIQISTVAIGLLSFSTFPVFTIFLESFFFKSAIKKSDILMVMIILSGIFLIVPTDEVSNISKGVFIGMISGFTFSLLSIVNKKNVLEFSSATIAFYQYLIAFLITSFFVSTEIIMSVSVYDLTILIFLGIFCTAVSHTLFIKGLSEIKATTASLIACLEPVYGIIFAFIFLNEHPDFKTISGGVIILSGVIFATRRKKVSQ